MRRLLGLWSCCVAATLVTGCASKNATFAPSLTQQDAASAHGTPSPINSTVYRIIHAFAGGKYGSSPAAPVLIRKGIIFGGTEAGGLNKGNCGGCGVTYSIQPNGSKFSVLYEYQGRDDGDAPSTQLVSDARGTLFGSSLGGAYPSYDGVVYSLAGKGDTGWKHTVLRTFNGGKDGDTPSGLVLGANGTTLFGTTQGSAESNCCGTAFQIESDGGGYRILHSFALLANSKVNKDGANPSGALVMDPRTGILYGTARSGGILGPCEGGCGTVFELAPSSGGKYAFAVLYRFKGGNDGEYPFDRLVLGATSGTGPPPIYGTTELGGTEANCLLGGAPIGCGTVYKLTASGSTYAKTTLYSFKGYLENDGQEPLAGLTLVGTTLYGTTSSGGEPAPDGGHYGSVFHISVSGANYAILHSFQGGKDGTLPYGGLTYHAGLLYGVTLEGGGAKACTAGGAVVGCGTLYAVPAE